MSESGAHTRTAAKERKTPRMGRPRRLASALVMSSAAAAPSVTCSVIAGNDAAHKASVTNSSQGDYVCIHHMDTRSSSNPSDRLMVRQTRGQALPKQPSEGITNC